MATSRSASERDQALIASALKLRFYPLIQARAEGAVIVDHQDRAYLDFTAGWTVMNAGYSHPHVVSRLKGQLEKSNFASLISGMHEPALRLAEELIFITPGDFKKKVWFGHSGSDATEAASRLLPWMSALPCLQLRATS